ncbi:MAG: hypothetical protein F6K23_00490 [Okeania sp. SIO2C9]|nr:hypothetical protein [Okeania sp. SIO2C9]NEQ71690.1 hypothetical protein [Okeania sp. SIO2C9]
MRIGAKGRKMPSPVALMVYKNKRCLVREQDAPTVFVTKIMTMHHH